MFFKDTNDEGKQHSYDGEEINIEQPTDWDVRQLLEGHCIDLVCSGPSRNTKACIRLMEIIDFIGQLDKGEAVERKQNPIKV